MKELRTYRFTNNKTGQQDDITFGSTFHKIRQSQMNRLENRLHIIGLDPSRSLHNQIHKKEFSYEFLNLSLAV